MDPQELYTLAIRGDPQARNKSWIVSIDGRGGINRLASMDKPEILRARHLSRLIIPAIWKKSNLDFAGGYGSEDGYYGRGYGHGAGNGYNVGRLVYPDRYDYDDGHDIFDKDGSPVKGLRATSP